MMTSFLRAIPWMVCSMSLLNCNAIYALIQLSTTTSTYHSMESTIIGESKVMGQWKLIEYDFKIGLPINDKNFYNPQNIVATGLAVSYDRIFVATPRLFSGVSATISTIPKNTVNKSPVYEAYPNWSFHTVNTKTFNCSDLGLVSVYRLRIDSCNRLWALDAGVSRSLEDFETTCPPKILIFDLATNQVVRRIDFPREVIRGESLFTNLIIDETTAKPGGSCNDVFVYISDTVEPAIVVYDSGNDLTWRVSHPSMYPDPDFAQSEIEGQKFVLMDGIVGLTFDSRAGLVYFQPLATERLFSVSKQVLRAGPLSNNEVLSVKLVGKKSSQGIGLTVSPFDGSIIFSPMTETAIAAWNPNTNIQSILAYDPASFQFVADMSLSQNEPSSFYCVSSKFHRFFLKNLNTNEYNTRILKINFPTKSVLPLHFSPSSLSVATTSSSIAHHVPQYPVLPKFSSYQHFGLTQLVSNSLLERKPLQNTGNEKSKQHFLGIEQPYQYEPVGLINRGITNPFTALNQGEEFPKKSALLSSSISTPSAATSSSSLSLINGLQHHSTSAIMAKHQEHYLSRIAIPSYVNFNNKARLPKNIAYY